MLSIRSCRSLPLLWTELLCSPILPFPFVAGHCYAVQCYPDQSCRYGPVRSKGGLSMPFLPLLSDALGAMA